MQQAVLDLAKRLIEFPSVTPDDAGAIKFISDMLEKQGFFCLEKTFGNNEYSVSNLYATLGEGKNFCFAGHVDVVPPGDKNLWQSNPFKPTVTGNRLTGRGAGDMKGALAAALVAGSKFTSDYPGAGKISYLITSDEEGVAEFGSKKMLEYLSQKDEKIDFCLIGEPTYHRRFGDTIKIGSRASANFELELIGKRGHVAYPDEAKNPIPEIGIVIQKLNNYIWDRRDEYFEASNLEFTSLEVDNKATNVVPESAKAYFNIRYKPELTIEFIESKITEIIREHWANYRLTRLENNPAYFSKPKEFAPKFKNLVESELKSEVSFSSKGGSSDGKFISKYAGEVIEFGLETGQAHQINEFLDIRDLQKLSYMYYKGLQHYFNVK